MGKSARGLMEAVNEVELELRLQHMGLDLVGFKLATRHQGLLRRRSVSVQDLFMFCLQLEQLTRAGVPLLDALMDLRDSTMHPHLHEVITALVSEMEGGKQLSGALASHPDVFNPVFVNLVHAGEQSGRLPQVFDNLAATLKWQDELMSQAGRLLAYPAFVLTVVMSTFSFLMWYLVPQMVSFLRNLGQQLPLETRILIALSNAFVHYWWLFLSLPLVILLVIYFAIKHSPQASYHYDYVKLHFPIVGKILQKIIMARIARYFALMYQSGIPILNAIKTCQDIASNRLVADALENARQRINAGASLSDSFQQAGLFPPLLVRMIRVGETTGTLEESLLNISYFYDRDVKDSVEKMLRMLEPALTVLLGLLLAMIMFSVLGPVYDALGKLKL